MKDTKPFMNAYYENENKTIFYENNAEDVKSNQVQMIMETHVNTHKLNLQKKENPCHRKKGKPFATVNDSRELKHLEEYPILDEGTLHNKKVIMPKSLFKYVI